MNDYKGGFTYVNPKLKDTFKPTEIKFTKVIHKSLVILMKDYIIDLHLTTSILNIQLLETIQ